MRVPPSVALALLVTSSGLAHPLSSQQPQPIGKPLVEFPEPFSAISGIRELSDGRVVVTDRRDKIVQILDFKSGTAKAVSREGSGPGEYALPSGALPMPNDQTLIVDLLNQRFLLIGPDGKPGETIPMPSLGGVAGGMGMSFARPQGSDAQGRLYFQGTSVQMGGPPAADSVPVVRWTPGGTTIDTAAWVVGPRTSVSSSGGGQMRVTMGMPMVFAPQEAWGVTPDGRVARVTPEPYRALWYAVGGKMTPGPTVPYTAPKVTEADKKAYRERQRANPPTMIMMTRGGASGNNATSMPAASLPEPEFAETKPPFAGAASVLVSPDGEIWVNRSRPAGDHTPVYDVFDSAGRLVRKVTLPREHAVTGFGKGSTYVVRTDEDGLQYLVRYAR
jgi:hypothetical protein